MSNIDYEELIRSPLDDEERAPNDRGSWGIAALGAVLGLVAGTLLFGLSNSDDPVPTEEAITTTTLAAVPDEIVADYPPGFVEVAPDLSVAPTELVLNGDSITVAFSSATRRGVDPAEVGFPVGGTWVLESSSGVVVESSRMVIGRFSPTAFTVHFPVSSFGSETEFSEIRMIDRWDVETFDGSITVPYEGEPFVMPEPQSVSVNQEVTLIIASLELGRFIGDVGWETTGSELGTTFEASATLLDAEDEFVGSYSRFSEIIDPAEAGYSEFFWSEPFPTDQEGAVTVSLDYVVGVAESRPVTVEIGLADVPIGR